jgi:predicted GNAT superfamily acetyltransferase
MPAEIEIRECATLEEMAECVQIQREVFALPEGELSPVRHFVVTRNAGGWALGAFEGQRLAGFVLSVPAFLRGKHAFYSHMTGVRPEYQSHGIGAKLKWAQRERALSDGVRFIKWTFEPVKARNAFFNLEKLGVVVREYMVNFYGTDYATAPEAGQNVGLDSDRLFAEWHLDSPKVAALASGNKFVESVEPTATIQVMDDWPGMVANGPGKAKAEQIRIREEFQTAFGHGMVCRGFWRDREQPAFLLYKG